MATKQQLEQEIAALREQVRQLQEVLVNALKAQYPVTVYPPAPAPPAMAPWWIQLPAPPFWPTAAAPMTPYWQQNICAAAGAPAPYVLDTAALCGGAAGGVSHLVQYQFSL